MTKLHLLAAKRERCTEGDQCYFSIIYILLQYLLILLYFYTLSLQFNVYFFLNNFVMCFCHFLLFFIFLFVFILF